MLPAVAPMVLGQQQGELQLCWGPQQDGPLPANVGIEPHGGKAKQRGLK